MGRGNLELGESIADATLARTEARTQARDDDDPVELDDDMMLHVVEASTEDTDDSPEDAEELAQVAREIIDLIPHLARSAAHPLGPHVRNPLQDQLSETKRKRAEKKKAFNNQKMKLARACRVINKQEGEIERLTGELQDVTAVWRLISPRKYR
jgi:hypothetical protein